MTIQDEVLAARIESSLAADKRTAGLPIHVRVSHGDAFVKGRVEYREQVEVVKFIVSGIPGVRHVDTSEVEVAEEDK
ncbi:MAG: BON domain-containing protein [Armatimonadota bacterium]